MIDYIEQILFYAWMIFWLIVVIVAEYYDYASGVN